MIVRRAVLALTLFVAAVWALLYFGPALFGKALVQRYAGPQVTVGSVTGPAWSPTAHDLTVSISGVQVSAQRANISVAQINTKALRFNVALENGSANVHFKELLSSLGSKKNSSSGKKSKYNFVPGQISVKNMRLNLDGKGANIPNATLNVSGQDGALRLQGKSDYGPLSGVLSYGSSNGAFAGTLDINSDARIVNTYWPGSIQGGQIEAQYRFGGGKALEGDLKVTDGLVVVPQAKFVKIQHVSGRAIHRGNSITGLLRGDLLGGPVQIKVGVDTKAKNWQLDGEAAPTFAGLGEALKVPGSGNARLKVSAGGWTTINVKAQLASNKGQLVGVPFDGLGAEYVFQSSSRNHKTTINRNVLSLQAHTTLLNESQKLWGNWHFNKKGADTAGTLHWTGLLGGKTLSLSDQIDPQNRMSIAGQGLGGPVNAQLNLRAKTLSAHLSPNAYGLTGQLALSGPFTDLSLQAQQLRVGPLNFSGTGRLDAQGLRATLGNAGGGTVQVNTNRSWRGNWQASGLKVGPATLTGSGDIDLKERLSGQLQASVPAINTPLSGPLSLNWKTKQGQWQAGEQRLTWQDKTFGLRAQKLQAGGLSLTGQVYYLSAGPQKGVSGQLSATGRGLKVVATGKGQQVQLEGAAAGVHISALSGIQSPYQTQATLRGADVAARLSYQQGVTQGLAFSLRTGQKYATGLLNGKQWNASGNIDLAALRPVLSSVLGPSGRGAARSVAGLRGNVGLNLRGLGGTLSVQAAISQGQITGHFTRRSGQLWADVGAELPQGVAAHLTGQVYPQVALSGPVRTAPRGQIPAQQLQARLTGPYRALKVALTGQSTALNLGGVRLPAQALNLSGSLTPALSLGGHWGALQANWQGGKLAFGGQQALVAAGRSGTVNLSGNWQPDFSGTLRVTGQLGEYQLAASGPWKALNVQLSGAGLKATGTVNAQSQRYQAQVTGQLSGLNISGNIQGVRANISGKVRLSDTQGGWADLQLASLRSFALQAHALRVAGQTLQGDLHTEQGLLTGKASLGPLSVQATKGQLVASGVYAQHRVYATGRLSLPSTLSDLNVRVDGPYLQAQASSSAQRLRGYVRLKAQTFSQKGVTAQLPAQQLPLSASLTPLAVNVGGLNYAGGQWSGQAALHYGLSGQAGLLALHGTGKGLEALPSGPLSGQVQLLPQFGGTLEAPLQPFVVALPVQARTPLTPGRVQATISRTGATFSTLGSRWQGAPLQLAGQVGWQGGLKVNALLSQGRTHIPVSVQSRHLRVTGATLDAWALRPFIKLSQPLSGQINATLDAPDLNFARATAQARINLSAGPQAAQGTVSLSSGQLSGDLSSTLGGQVAELRGPLYPAANATVHYAGLRGTIQGDARREGQGQWAAHLGGEYQNKAVQVSAQLSPRQVGLSATIAGATVQATARAQTTPQGNTWAVQGNLQAPDLRPLAGQTGHLAGTFGGTLADLQAQLSGVVAGSSVSIPARYRNGSLSVQQAQAVTPVSTGQAHTTLSGTVWPSLNVRGSTTLNTLAPGRYALSATGPLSRPTVQASGTLQQDIQGFGVAGTQLQAVLSGKDFRVVATGAKLSGELSGRTDFAGYLQRAQLQLDLPYSSAQNTLHLRGPLGWNAAQGWSGNLTAAGVWAKRPLSAQLQGRGVLGLEAYYGPGEVSGELGSYIWQKPSGTLRLSRLDIGSLWQRPGQLALTGSATLAGQSWKNVQAQFLGKVQDTGAGDLSGPVRAQYQQGNASLTLSGRKLSAAAQLKQGHIGLNLHSGGVELARLLPPKWDVSALKLVGIVEASAGLNSGLERLNVRSLYLSGQQGKVGDFRLMGAAQYLPAQHLPKIGLQPAQSSAQASTNLSGYVLGGAVSARGSLPAGLNIEAQNLNLKNFGGGKANANLKLLGDLQNPSVSGSAQLSRPEAQVSALVSGRLQDPKLHLRATLQGQYAGTLYADATRLNISKQVAQLHLYGTAQQASSASNRAQIDMRGVWPNLSGQLSASIAGISQPVTVQGQGNGQYRLSAGNLGQGTLSLTGLNPQVTGSATLHPLPLLGATGQGDLQLSVSGPVSKLQLSGSGLLSGVQRSGVTLPDTVLSVSGTPASLQASLSQSGQTVATMSGKTLSLNGLQLGATGSRLTLSGGGELGQTLSAQVSATGTLSGNAKLSYGSAMLSASGAVAGAGFNSNFQVSANKLTGWKGTLKATGGPRLEGIGPVLSSPLSVQVSGPYERPLLTGDLGLGGAQAKLIAGQAGMQLRLSDGPLTKASGLLSLNKVGTSYRWNGAAQLSRRKGELNLSLAGEAGQPIASLKTKLGQWYASGSLNSQKAQLDFGDGLATGNLHWDGQNLNLSSQALDLARLGIPGVAGSVQPAATLDSHRTGHVTATLNEVVTGYTLPYLNMPLDGSGKLSATFQQGAVAAAGDLNLAAGPLSFSASQVRGQQGQTLWQGQLQTNLKQAGGSLSADIALKDSQTTGTLSVNNLALKVGMVGAKLQGQVALQGQTFNANLQATSGKGKVSVSGDGGLANLLPSLSALSGLKATPDGYQVQAQLSGLDLGQLGMDGVQGAVNGQLLLGEGSGTFVLRSGGLKLGESQLSTRLDGNLAGGDWRLRGHIGDSTLFGAVTEGKLSARMQLQALPVGSVITAFTGKTVGQGLVTGVARLEMPLADPLSGSATLVAERVKVTTGSQELTGQGSLNFANHELTHILLNMQGSQKQITGPQGKPQTVTQNVGTWDIHGQYTRQKVDLTAAFTDTTFTPVLALIPTLENQATLQGSLNLKVGGSYEQPTATLTGRNLDGTWAGIHAQVAALNGALSSAGNLSAQAGLVAAGTVGGTGQLRLSGTLADGQLSAAQLGYQGTLSADSLGDLGQSTVTLAQTPSKAWQLEALAQQGGSLKVSGQVAPSINLALNAQNYNLPIRTIYARESSLNGALTAATEGDSATGNIVVSGNLNFAQMLLGRVKAAAVLPGSTKTKTPVSSYVSPLPTALTTFDHTNTDPSDTTPKINIPFLKRVVFNDIPIRAPGNIRVDESIAQADLTADLKLSGKGDNPLLTGDVHNLRGSLTLRDNEFSIQKAVATFDGSGLYPIFSLTAQGQVPDANGTRIGVQLQADGSFGVQAGQAGRGLILHTDLTCTTCTSGTSYTQAELYSLLALGTPDITALGSTSSLTNLGTSAVSTALNMFVLGELQRNIAKALGVDVFRINSNLINADGSVDARFTVGTYLSKQFYVQYQVDLTGAGLIDATYTTDDGRFTFKASTPLSGFDLSSVRPSFSTIYNIGTRHSLSLGVQSGLSTKFSAGYVYKW